MLKVANATFCAIIVKSFPLRILRAHGCGEFSARCAMIYARSLRVYFFLCYIVFRNCFSKCHAVNTLYRSVEQFTLCQFAQNAEDTACTVTVFHGVLLRIRGKLAKTRHSATQSVYILHLKVHTAFVCHGKKMKNSICRSSHCYIKRHGVQKGFSCGYTTRKNALIAFAIIFICILNNQFCCVLEQLNSIDV